MKTFKFQRSSIELLIDTLIQSGGGVNPYGKLSEILDSLMEDEEAPAFLRHNLLVWLDTMGIINVNFQDYSYHLFKPAWVPTSVEGRYILMGALTTVEKFELEKEGVPALSNKVLFKEIELELPQTFYCDDFELIQNTKHRIHQQHLFSNVDECKNKDEILETLQEAGKCGQLSTQRLILSDDGREYWRYSFIEDSKSNSSIDFSTEDLVYKFNWRNKSFEKCDIAQELYDVGGVKLITINKELTGARKKKYTLLLEKEPVANSWSYYYFDTAVIDERWAKFIYIAKEKKYDLYYDLQRADVDDPNKLLRPLTENLSNYNRSQIKEKHEYLDIDKTNQLVGIPDALKESVLFYDEKNGIAAIPRNLPLPNIFMRFLFSCSGNVPQVYINKFGLNPNYPIKLLFSGKLSNPASNITYPEEYYYIEEELYLFGSVPPELIKILTRKVGLPFYKKTFLRTLK